MRLGLAALPPARADSVARVDAAKRGAAVVVDAVIVVPVPLSVAWAVMNDFDAMARYAPNLTRIEYRARMEPAFRVPGFISRPIIEQPVREQCDALAAQMLRRRAQSAAGAAHDGR